MPDPVAEPPAPLGRLADVLDAVLPTLPETLASPEAVARVRPVAALLPAIGPAGLECRLAAGDGRVDLQQGLSRARNRPRAMAAFAGGGESDVWRRVAELCAAWAQDGGVLAAGLDELWLEYDVVDDATPATLDDLVPLVFATLSAEGGDRALRAADAVLDAVLDDPAPARSVVERCAPAGRVSHVGVLLGRPFTAVRVHLSGVPIAGLPDALSTAGWPGAVDEAVELARLLLDHADEVVVCLDALGDSLLPRLGLEAFHELRGGVEPRWWSLLGALAERGLADPAKAEALLAWPGATTPVTARWPDLLVLRDLGMPEDRLSLVERRLSHVKLTCAPGEPVAAKAYFGFGHTTGAAAGEPAPAPRPAPRVVGAATVEDAVGRAVAFLAAARNQGGWWRDFYDRARPHERHRRLGGYASDEWVSAYVGAALAPVAPELAAGALDNLLARRGPPSGWGYNASYPPDADTTAWALRLARALGAPEDARLRAARAFLVSLVGADGGVATYAPADARTLIEALRWDEEPPVGWTQPHTDVTAAASILDLGPGPREHLRRAQREDGAWSGHWWDDDEYTTARAVEALAGEHDVVARAARWAAGRVGADGAVVSAAHGGPSPFATALALQVLAAGEGHGDTAAAATRWLLGRQREDGSWEPSAGLAVPAPHAPDRDASTGLGCDYLDDDATFTTATVVAALTAQRA